MVCCGVFFFGVVGPKTAMDEGQNILSMTFSLANSNVCNKLCMFKSHAFIGNFSPVALSMATRWYTVPTLYFSQTARNPAASLASRISKGPFLSSTSAGSLMSVATTASLPYFSRRVRVSSVPIWPQAPRISVVFFML